MDVIIVPCPSMLVDRLLASAPEQAGCASVKKVDEGAGGCWCRGVRGGDINDTGETCAGYKGNGNEDTVNWYYATENIACYGINGL